MSEHLPTEGETGDAESAVKPVLGVCASAEGLTMDLSGGVVRADDDEVVHAAASALNGNVSVAHGKA